jgi:hypothetical protein
MKQKILTGYLLSILIVSFGTVSPALAQIQVEIQTPELESEQVENRSRNIIRERIEKQRESYLQNLQEARRIAEERQRQGQAPAGQGVENTQENSRTETGFLVRLTNAAEQLANMQDRTEIRIKYYQEKGFDITTAKAYLDRSEEALLQMLTHQETLRNLLQTANQEGEKSPEEINREARMVFEKIQSSFKDAQQYLRESLSVLRDTVLSKENQNRNTTNTR